MTVYIPTPQSDRPITGLDKALPQHSSTSLEDGPSNQVQLEPNQIQTRASHATASNTNRDPLNLTPLLLMTTPCRSPRLKAFSHLQPNKPSKQARNREGAKHYRPFISHDQVLPVMHVQAIAILHGSGLQVTGEMIEMIEATFRRENQSAVSTDSTIIPVHNSVHARTIDKF
jgi:hypothetical protein